jgi:tetratricopeptide (TPR) repeat protein
LLIRFPGFMREKTDYYNYDESAAMTRYNKMREQKSSCYFDVFEFENIIDNYIDQHELKLANEAIEYALRIHPDAFSIQQRLAQLYINQGLYYKSLKLLRNLHKIEPSNSTVCYLLGVVYCSLGEISRALNQFDSTEFMDLDEREDFYINAGTTLEQVGQYEFAIKYFKKAIQLNPENSTAIYEMAFCAEKLDYDIESIQYYKNYLYLDPYSKLAWTNLAAVYYKLEDYHSSVDAIEFAIAIDPAYSYSYFQKGLCEILSKDYQKGIESLHHFLQMEPDDAEAYFYLGEAYLKIGKNMEALSHFRKVISIDHLHSDAFYGMATIHYQAKKFFRASSAIKKAIELDPVEADYWHLSALINKNLGLIEDSEKAFLTGIELENSDPRIWIDYSELEDGSSCLVKKIDILSQAFEHFSEDAEINYRLAAHLALQQNLDKAAYHLNKALKAEPSQLDIFRSIYSAKIIIFENIIEKYTCRNFNEE